jgi:pimeloyl-ACP methyl ester carboxylesterase
MADGIPGAQLEVIEGGGHLCTVGEPDAVTSVLTAFFDKHKAEAT